MHTITAAAHQMLPNKRHTVLRLQQLKTQSMNSLNQVIAKSMTMFFFKEQIKAIEMLNVSMVPVGEANLLT